MWMMLQQPQGDDYVLATGEMHSVREFVERAFACVNRKIVWKGSGPEEVGIDERSGEAIVLVDPHYFRPTEVEQLLGDASKARAKLGWSAKTTFPELVAEMVESDIKAIERESWRNDWTAR
jgi:GDPmannose 4,6-dehydratase